VPSTDPSLVHRAHLRRHEQKVIAPCATSSRAASSRPDLRDLPAEEDVTEFKSGKKVTVSKRMSELPADPLRAGPRIFYVIGSTPGVTGFVGAEKTARRPDASRSRQHHPPVRRGCRGRATKRRMPTTNLKSTTRCRSKRSLRTFSGHVAEINEDQLKSRCSWTYSDERPRWSSTSPRSPSSRTPRREPWPRRLSQSSRSSSKRAAPRRPAGRHGPRATRHPDDGVLQAVQRRDRVHEGTSSG